ncbi:MAG: sodium transporter [Calditrichaeota bacterium]|nr:MAG: sodium transporter [Calditrichota bacterium]
MGLNIGVVDLMIIFGYFAAVFGIAIWSTKRDSVRESSTGYFLAGRNIGWIVVGTSLFASNIGSEHLVGLAGTGADSGVAVGQFEILASLILLILGWVFVPFYLKSGVFTMPEFLERRYSKGARAYLSWVSIIGYVLTKISVTIYAGGIVFEAMGMNFWVGAFIVVIATGIYTVFGGLRAVVFTEFMQTFVLIGGAVLVTGIGLWKIGGWGALYATAGSSFFNMWQPATHPDFPWTGILFGAPILGVWYWCTDQFIVQRVLSAKNIDNARRGTILGGYLKVLPLFIFVIPGVIAYALAQKGIITLDKADKALPTLIDALLPVGIKGIVLAGLLAALMSSLSAVFNSCSTLITIDIYKQLHPTAPEKRLVLVGQIATVMLVVLGLLWIPFMKFISGELYKYLQSVQAYISPPIAAVFLLGVFMKRLNGTGAIVSLLSGFVLGMGRLIAELNKEHLSGLLYEYATINFLHFAILLFVICSAILIVVSLLTSPPPPEKVDGLTYSTASEYHSDPVWKRKDVLLSILLVLVVGMVWLYFTG